MILINKKPFIFSFQTPGFLQTINDSIIKEGIQLMILIVIKGIVIHSLFRPSLDLFLFSINN